MEYLVFSYAYPSITYEIFSPANWVSRSEPFLFDRPSTMRMRALWSNVKPVASSKVAHVWQTFSPFLPSTIAWSLTTTDHPWAYTVTSPAVKQLSVRISLPTTLTYVPCCPLVPLHWMWSTVITYNVLCCPLVPVHWTWSTVIKHNCVDLCRACGSQIYSQWGHSRSPIILNIVLVIRTKDQWCKATRVYEGEQLKCDCVTMSIQIMYMHLCTSSHAW